ncbi:MAG: gfo/Idh/MocA family oxidoreductase, partial [Planctomycetes bacterium]|nr:gfo/Idh/MocA family oxidoreductase [Planctomycetota bacterium]
LIPSSALRLNGTVPPSGRIVMGFIGVGSQGRGNMLNFLSREEVRVVAVCDVDQEYRERAKRNVDEKYGNNDCAVFLDFMDLIDRIDLDAVALALPDHWHAIPAIAAARDGLDIYGE